MKAAVFGLGNAGTHGILGAMSVLRSWRDRTTEARLAIAADRPGVSELLASARRRHGITALEEQVALLNGGTSAVAFADDEMSGFLGISVRQPAGSPAETWTDIVIAASSGRGAPAETIGALLSATMPALRARGATGLMSLVASGWLKSALGENGFAETDRVVSYARDGRQVAPTAVGPAALRTAQPGDTDAVLALNADAFEPMWQYDEATTLTWFITSEHSVIAESAGRPVGFALTSTAADGRHAQLIRVAVHPDAQGRGIGRQLVVDAIRFASDSGATGLSLNTQASNAIARRLYGSLGFRVLPNPLSVMVRRLFW